ncbi:MAG: helix-turn-helix transcriptional regulator [Proteobacteria bacterium]|jgi:putative transcriptional regulator|nr:helix-turn-helix transcriptional regulator [Pseudomonadota bacterium]
MARKSPFTNTIRRLRFDHDEMTQEDLARRIGATRQTVSALEANRYVPSLLLAVRIARTFGVAVENVFVLGEVGDE